MERYDLPDSFAGNTFPGFSVTSIKRNGANLSTTLASVKMQVRKDRNSTASVIELESGNGITINSATTWAFTIEPFYAPFVARNYVYDVELTDSSGTVQTYMRGSWRINQPVTSPGYREPDGGLRYYVDQDSGDDSNTGWPDAPLETIEEGVTRARASYESDRGVVIVGDYYSDGLTIGSGTETRPLRYEGGTLLAGSVPTWEDVGGGVYRVASARPSNVADRTGIYAEIRSDILSISGLNSPGDGTTSTGTFNGRTTFYYDGTDLDNAQAGDIIVRYTYWVEEWTEIASVDTGTKLVTLVEETAYGWNSGNEIQKYRLLRRVSYAPALLGARQWYHDGTYTYIKGEATARLVSAKCYFDLAGASNFVVDGVTFEGGGFDQANAPTPSMARGGCRQEGDATVGVVGGSCSNAQFLDVTIKHGQLYGLAIDSGSSDVLINGVEVSECSGGIRVGGVSAGTQNANIAIINSSTRDLGAYYKHGYGIMVTRTRDGWVLRNDVYNVETTAIKLGFFDSDVARVMIEHNLIYDIGTENLLLDFGGIHTNGNCAVSTIRYNVASVTPRGGFGSALYYDEGTQSVDAYQNECYGNGPTQGSWAALLKGSGSVYQNIFYSTTEAGTRNIVLDSDMVSMVFDQNYIHNGTRFATFGEPSSSSKFSSDYNEWSSLQTDMVLGDANETVAAWTSNTDQNSNFTYSEALATFLVRARANISLPARPSSAPNPL